MGPKGPENEKNFIDFNWRLNLISYFLILRSLKVIYKL